MWVSKELLKSGNKSETSEGMDGVEAKANSQQAVNAINESSLTYNWLFGMSYSLLAKCINRFQNIFEETGE